MVLNSLFPVFAMIAAGAVFKHFHFTDEKFLKTSDRLVYFIFFPALLFWKIGRAGNGISLDRNAMAAVLCALVLIYILSAVCIRIFRISDFQAGSFSQGCYRFNTYIGMAVVLNATGERGIAFFGLLVGTVIPIINVLAVSTLIWFSGKHYSTGERVRICLKALVSNPLILACLAGLIYARFVNTFPVFIDNAFRLGTSVTLPLALFSIGGALAFKTLKDHFLVALIAAGIKLVIFPVVGYLFLNYFQVTGLTFKVLMIFFTLPVSPAIYVLSSQLSSDTVLASAVIVLSTLLSFFSLSAALLL
jgi:predicted permease